MAMENASDKIVNSVIITAVARVAMLLAMPTIGLLFWLYAGWQTDKLDGLQRQIEQAQKSSEQASGLSIKLSERLTTVETKQSEATISSERFQTATLQRLDRMSDSLIGLSNAVAALTSSVQAISEDRRAARSPPAR